MTPRIQVLHAAAPTCFWSWGYEAMVNRLRLVYGDQIDVHVPTFRVEPSARAAWLEAYGMTEEELDPYLEEARELVGVPLAAGVPDAWFPDDNEPATLAVMAAARQGRGDRMRRELLRRVCVEAEDVSRTATIEEAAEASGCDVARFRKDFADAEGLRADVDRQGENLPPLHVGFYNVGLTDGLGRTVVLDYAFDPSRVEDAVEWLSGGRLRKSPPTDVAAYLAEHGAAPTLEVARVFAWSVEDAERRLRDLAREGTVARDERAGAAFWTSASARAREPSNQARAMGSQGSA